MLLIQKLLQKFWYFDSWDKQFQVFKKASKSVST